MSLHAAEWAAGELIALYAAARLLLWAIQGRARSSAREDAQGMDDDRLSGCRGIMYGLLLMLLLAVIGVVLAWFGYGAG